MTNTRRTIGLIAAAVAVAAGLALAGTAAATDAPGTTGTTLLAPGTTPSSDDKQTHGTGTLIQPPRSTTTTTRPGTPPQTVTPSYTG